jgi:hypothetical protein
MLAIASSLLCCCMLYCLQVLQCSTANPSTVAPLDLSLSDAVAFFGCRYVASDIKQAEHHTITNLAAVLWCRSLLYRLQVLQCNTDDPAAGAPLDLSLPDAIASFGRRYVASDSSTALQYYMLAAELAGGGVKEQGRLFRELLVQSKDYGEQLNTLINTIDLFLYNIYVDCIMC